MLRDYLAHLSLFSRNARLFLAGAFFFGFGFGTFWVLENLYLREVGLSESEIGRVLSMGSVGMLVAAPLVAWLTRRFRTRTLLIAAALVSTIAYAGIAFGTTMGMLLPASALAGECRWPRPAPRDWRCIPWDRRPAPWSARGTPASPGASSG